MNFFYQKFGKAKYSYFLCDVKQSHDFVCVT